MGNNHPKASSFSSHSLQNSHTRPQQQQQTATYQPQGKTASTSIETSMSSDSEENSCLWAWGALPIGKSSLTPKALDGDSRGTTIFQNSSSIVQVSVGPSHTLFAVDTGLVYCSGDGSYGQLANGKGGRGIDYAIPMPIPSNLFQHQRICQVACGRTFSVACSETNNVYVWGTMKLISGDGFKGIDKDSMPKNKMLFQYDTPTIVSKLQRHRIVKIAAGGAHILFLDIKGVVRSWGNPEWGRLGRSKPNFLIKKVELSDQISTIECSDQLSIALSSEGDVYTFGRSREGNVIYTPKLIAWLCKKHIIDIKCGMKQGIALTKTGGILEFSTDFIDPNDAIPEIQLKDRSLKSVAVTAIAAGKSHNVALSSVGEVYTWGSSIFGQLGHGHTTPETYPRLVRGLAKVRMFSIAAGGDSTIATSALNLSSLTTDFKKVLDKPSDYFPDMSLVIVDAIHGTKKLSAHRAMLSVRTRKFHKVLESHGKLSDEGTPAWEKVRIEIKSSLSAAQSFLEYIYTDRTSTSSSAVDDLIRLAQLFDVPRLLELCQPHLPLTDSRFVEDLKVLLPFQSSSSNTHKYYDLEIAMANSKFGANKFILAARSEYYRSMLSSNMAEAQSNTIVLGEEIEQPVFENLLRYIYCDETPEDSNEGMELMQLANQIRLERLITLCERKVEKDVEIDTVLYVYQAANMFGASHLRHFCLNFIKDKAVSISKTAYWREMSSEDRSELAGIVPKLAHTQSLSK